MNEATSKPNKPRVNLRRPDVMEQVTAEVARHYHSTLVEHIRDSGGTYRVGKTTIKLASEFGFCYGVERAIDLAYAARRVFPNERIFLVGEIIHNPDVNRQLTDMQIASLPWREMDVSYDALTEDDIVILPAFGAPVSFIEKIESRGCRIVDTTCGDVMKVWRRVREYARDGFTSIIHGKAGHEETRATASRALGVDGKGHYLVVLTLDDTDVVCDFIRNGDDPQAFLTRFAGSHSEGFDPVAHLARVGVANQTTMLKSETEEIQRRLRRAMTERDGGDTSFFRVFDTICGATQERQDALFDLLREPPDMLIVVGGYNSSNTAHLVEIAEPVTPTFFIRNAGCIESLEQILHFDLHGKSELRGSLNGLLDPEREVTVGITAGASCPANLIEETIHRVLALRGESAPA